MWNAEEFRIPEESVTEHKIRSHAGKNKVEKLFPETPQELEQDSVLCLNLVMKEGVRITKSTRPDVFEIIEASLSLFGHSDQIFEVFALKNLPEPNPNSTTENATFFVEEGKLIFVFIQDILQNFGRDEIKFVIGHEIGHFLLNHLEIRKEFAPLLIALTDSQANDILDDQPDLYELLMYLLVFFQIQELSSDRIGLLITQDLRASISGMVKLHGGFFSEIVNIDDYIQQGKELPPLGGKDLVDKSHPYGPKRSWALFEFYKSDLFNRSFGKISGDPIAKFSTILPQIIPFPEE